MTINSSPTFSVGDGKITTDFGAADSAGCVALQSDGKILVAGGNGDFVLARYNADGSLDNSFDSDGKVTTDFANGDDVISNISIQSDGKVLVSGYTSATNGASFALARYNTDGSLDSSFGTLGKTTTTFSVGDATAYSATTQSDGKILLVGSSSNGTDNDFAIARYNADGSLDTAFDGDGKLTVDFGGYDNDARDVVVQADGKILVVGSSGQYDISRLNPDGSLDTSFDGDGKFSYTYSMSSPDQGFSIALQPDGKILMGGATDFGKFSIARLNSDGTFDSSFGVGGWVVTDVGAQGGTLGAGASVLLQSDGKILAAGDSNNSVVFARYNSDGTLDSTLDGDGIVTSSIYYGYGNPGNRLTQQSDGKILIVGYGFSHGNQDVALVRYSLDGGLDTTFNPVNSSLNGAPTYTENGAAVVLDSDVQINDPDLTASSYSGSSLTLARNGGANTQDLFSGSGITAGQASGDVIVSSTTIGNYTYAAGSLAITFNASATQALVNSAMRGIAYSNSSDNPPAPVQIDWTFNDGNTGAQGTGGALSTTGSTTVTIIPVNDMPTGTNGSITLDEDTSHTFTAAEFGFNDIEDGSTLTGVRIDTLPIAGSLKLNGTSVTAAQVITAADLAVGKLTFTPEVNASGNGYGTITFSVVDSGNGFDLNPNILTLNVTTANDIPSFSDGDGKVTTDFGGFDVGQKVTSQADGKILVAGGSSNDFAIARYNTDGSLDISFDGDGKVASNFGLYNYPSGYSFDVQTDGKILVVGTILAPYGASDFVLVRYNTDGSLDNSFSGAGFLALGVSGSTTVQADGKILVAGNQQGTGNFVLARYNYDGSLDTGFDGDGIVTTNFGSLIYGNQITVQADGKMLVAGNNGAGSFVLVRYNTDGSLDTSFDGDGIVTTNFGSSNFDHDITVQADGKILVAGFSSNGSDLDFALARYKPDGSLDTSFDGDGIVTTDIGLSSNDNASSITLQSNGKILVAGSSNSNIALVRYNTDGSLDSSFDGDGSAITSIGTSCSGNSVTVQADGKILVTGSSYNGIDNDFALVSFNPDGSLDNTFDAVNALNGTPSYTENNNAVVLDSTVSVYDAELAASGNYSGASITLARHGNANTQDQFSATGNLYFSGGNVVLSAVTIGTLTNSGGTLAITFNSKATQAVVNETLSSVAYSNSSDAPPASVQIDWIFSDGNTGAQGAGSTGSVTGSTIVTITSVNDAPILSGPASSLIACTEDIAYTVSAANLLTGWTDADTGATLSVTGLVADHGAVGNNGNGNGTFTITPTANYNGTMVLSYSVTDGTASVATTLGYTLAAVNDLPTGSVTITGNAAQGQLLTAINNLADDDGLGTITYTWKAGTTTVGSGSTYTLPNAEVGQTITVTASYTDGYGTAESVTSSGLLVKALVTPPDLDTISKDTVTGGVGNEFLDGGAGADKMTGGGGDDTYIVDNVGDKVIELADGGTDDVLSSLAKYTLPKNVENLTLTGLLGTENLNGTGNELPNILTGNDGNNLLDGGKQVDTYIGGGGDDTYILDSLLETDITEYVGEGNDTIKLKINTNGDYALNDSSEVENLTITGSGLINLTGNALDNLLTGNAKGNILTGLDGNDTLNGGAGVDTLIGGNGDDTYIVDKATDVVTELAGEGADDTIISNTGLYVLNDTSEVENLTIGKGAGKGTGNALDNTLTGNDSANTLDGAAGNDILNGGKGADKLIGGEGADTLNGGLGNDKLTGNAGADIFIFNEPLKGNVDTITDFITGEDILQLDTTLVFTNAILAADADGVLDIANFRADDSLAHLKAAQETDDFILYDNKAGVLYYDADGSGTDFAAVKFATLTKIVGVAPSIDAGDIALV